MQKTNNDIPGSIWWLKGFYDYPIEGGVEITTAYWQELLKGQECGYTITEDEKGYPVLKSPEPPSAEELRQNEIVELRSKLAATDWIHSKCKDLDLKAKDVYPDVVAQRIAWRERIDELEKQGV